jgi:hypothetical protein
MNSQFTLRVSLGLNVILAVAAVGVAMHRPEPLSTPAAAQEPVAPANESRPGIVLRPLRFTEQASRSDQRHWLIDELRAMGVPNKILARIAQQDIDANWNKFAAELTLKCRGDSDTMAALQLQIDSSMDEDMRAALGDEGFKQWDRENLLRETDPGKLPLTAAETDTAYDLWKKFHRRELELKQARLEGKMDEADMTDAQDKAYTAFNQQMKALLGDERYAQSQQTDSATAAANLRDNFAKANPTDAQFQQLLQTQQQWNERRAEIDKQFQDNMSSVAYNEQIKELDAARDTQYQSVLGTNVFTALQKEQDPGYMQMKKHEAIWGLDDGSIDSIYGTLKYYEKSISEYQTQAHALEANGQTVDWKAVDQNLQQFSQQIQQSLKNYLGQDRFSRLQQNGVLQFNQNQFSYNVKGDFKGN